MTRRLTKTTSGKQWAIALLGGALGGVCVMPAAHACELKITWQAALAGSPSAPSPGMGTAAIEFDATHPGATVNVDTRNLKNVRVIELHVARSFTDHTGPAVLTFYTLGDGQTPTALTRRVGEADLHKQATPKIAAFGDLVTAVLNGQAYVVVATQAHPEGELSGIIRMHKEEIFSNSGSDTAHDAALHHAARATTPSPTP